MENVSKYGYLYLYAIDFNLRKGGGLQCKLRYFGPGYPKHVRTKSYLINETLSLKAQYHFQGHYDTKCYTEGEGGVGWGGRRIILHIQVCFIAFK